MLDQNTHRRDSTIVGPPVAPIVEVVQGNELGRIVRLKLRTRLGRERDNEVVLTDPRVSRNHAIIELDDGRWVIRDQGSVNGTFVNRKRISAGRVLQPDDHIVLGDTEMVFQPSRVGVGARVAPTSPGRQAAAASRLPASIHPQWGWHWIASGAVLVVALLAFAVFTATQGRGSQTPAMGVKTAVVDTSAGDFTLVYEDDFSDPGSGWDDTFDRYSVKQYGNDRYYIEITTSNLVAWGLANRDVADFRLEVEATQESGPNNNGYGVLFRFTDRDNYYRFDISGEGYFLLSRLFQGEWTTLVPWTASSALNVGRAANKLMVEAVGDRIRLLANGMEIARARDSSLSHGNFGFFANTFTDPNLVVSFDDISLWAPTGEAVAVIPTATPTRMPRAPTVVVSNATLSPTSAAAGDEGAAGTIAARSPTAEIATVTPRPTPVATAAPTGSPTPVLLPDYASRDVPLARNAVVLTGRFFFPVYDAEAGTYDIFSAGPDGSDRQKLVEQASQPAVNSDGQRMVYRSWKADNRGLVERAVPGGTEWRFDSHFEAARAAFAPDGRSFLFHSREAGAQPAIYRTIGTQPEVLRREGGPIQGLSPAWVDKDRFIYQGCLGNACGLILSNLDGSFPKQLTQDPDDTNADVSLDGQQVVFMSRRGGNWDIYRLGIDGSNLVQLTSDGARDGLPIWSADGKTVAFVSDRDGMWELWAMDPDGDNQRPLFGLGGPIDGVASIDVQNSRGWVEERIDWSP